MPRYQAVIEFWAYRDSHADNAVEHAVSAIKGLTLNTKENAEKEGIATGDIETKLNIITPLSDDYVYPAATGAPTIS